jgi:hypothetical protein
MTTEEDDSEVMLYFWNKFLDNDQDEETNKLCKHILDHFAVGSFHWFLRTTEGDLMQYKELIYSYPSISLEEKKKLDNIIEKFLRCQWYVFYTLHTQNLAEMTAQKWKKVTSQDHYINFATFKYFQVKHNSLVCLLRENYMNDFISESPFVEEEDVKKDELNSYDNIKSEDVDNDSSDSGEKNTNSTMGNGELSLKCSSNDNNISNSFSCHSGLHYVDLVPVPLLDHGEDSQSINDTKSSNVNDILNAAKGKIDKELIQNKNNRTKDAESTIKDAKCTTINKEMIKHKNGKEIVKDKNNNQIVKDETLFQDSVFNHDNPLFPASTYMIEDQEVDCHEEEIIFSCDNDDDDDGFDWHESKVLINGIFTNTEIWNLPFLEHKYDININLNMPKTHKAFQQAISELSQPQPNTLCRTSENHYKTNEYLVENKSSSLEYSENSGMGRNKESVRSVLPGRNSMGREETEDTSGNQLIQHLQLVSSMDILKFLVNAIHFASTARTLFAEKVSQHDNYIHDCNQDNIWLKIDFWCGKHVKWKMSVIDFREVLTKDDEEYSSWVMWKINKLYIKEVLTLNDRRNFGINFIIKLRMWNCDPHTRNDGECHVRVFIPLGTLFNPFCSLLCENQKVIISYKKLNKTSYLRNEKALLEGGSLPTTPGGKNIFEELIK